MRMTLEKVLDQIRAEAAAQAEAIKEEGNREAARIMGEAEAEAERRRAGRKRELQEELAHRAVIRQSNQRIAWKRRRLQMEKRMLEELWDRLCQRVATMPTEQNAALLKQLLSIARASPAFSIQSLVTKDRGEDAADARPATLLCHPKDEELLRTLSDLDIAPRLSSSIGGIIAEAEDGSWRLNLTYDVLLRESYERAILMVHQLLMGEKKDG